MAINKNASPKSKTKLAKELGVSRSSLYYKHKIPAKDEALKQLILTTFEEHAAYGHKRLAIALKINKKRIRRVMRKYGLAPKRRRKSPRKKKDELQEPATTPNLLKELILNRKGQAWVSDFTYLWHFNKFTYLATVIDAYTKEVVGWAMSNRHDTNLVANALLNALQMENEHPLIFHSDQGSEYKSEEFRNMLKSNNIWQSMSKKGSPWQNGYQESFYGKFKLDLGHPECYKTAGELFEGVAKTVYYYNNKRIHTVLKMPPALFAKQHIDLKK